MNEAICEAIRKREILQFSYSGKERVVEPHLYGWNAESRREILSGYQIAGASGSAEIPSWRTFYAARISGLRFLSTRFAPQPDFNPDDPVITILYCAVESP